MTTHMGVYINRGYDGFARYTNGEYVDKTGLIAYINSTLSSATMLTCVTRPRRFGKTAAAKMLYAYYDQSCDASALFDHLQIAPRRNGSYPALVVELKWNQSSDTAIDQIKKRHYPDVLQQFSGNILLVGISYDEKTKEHTCKIEQIKA